MKIPRKDLGMLNILPGIITVTQRKVKRECERQAQSQAVNIENSHLEAIANHNESAAFFEEECCQEFNGLKCAFSFYSKFVK